MLSILDSLHRATRRRFWIFSDLQQSDPANAFKCMHTGVSDFISLSIPIDAICYLGDSTEGTDLARLREMADMQVAELSRVDAPVYYVMGNHEMDYHRHADKYPELTLPMRERILREPKWHTTASPLDWALTVDFGDMSIILLSDRCDPAEPSWVTSHCGIRKIDDVPQANHDFTPDIDALRERLLALDKPVFTMSHYSFPGGNRDAEGPLQAELLPLPETVAAHFYGHSHIGDKAWGRENLFRQVSTVNGSRISQFDIASLENRRGTAVRSALLEWYGGRSFGVFFRNHSDKSWEKIHLEN